MIVLLLWIAGLILGIAISLGWGWGFLYQLEIWAIKLFGKIERL